jgi:hypothetical protein
MSSEERRLRRLRLLAGILIGVFVGTAHALVSHVVSGDGAEAAVVRPYTLLTPDVDASAR